MIYPPNATMIPETNGFSTLEADGVPTYEFMRVRLGLIAHLS